MQIARQRQGRVAERGQAGVRVRSVGTAVPPHAWSQDEVLALLGEHFPGYRRPIARQLFDSTGIERRHFALAREDFDPNPSVGELHGLYRAAAPQLASAAAREALARAGVSPREIGLVVVATCTGYLCPGLTALLARDLDFGDDVQRADLVGMGCAGAMPALQRAWDYARAVPGRQALVVTVEICSACWFTDEDDGQLETVVGNAICADGAAALVVGTGPGSGRDARLADREAAATAGPEVLDFETFLDSSWIEEVGLENREGRHRIVLSKRIRKVAGPASQRSIERLLARHGLLQSDVAHWVFHAGGRAVLDGIDHTLGFGPEVLAPSREVLRGHGNMSSPTVLFVLDELQRTRRPRPGELGVMLALGPGLAAETALLRW